MPERISHAPRPDPKPGECEAYEAFLTWWSDRDGKRCRFSRAWRRLAAGAVESHLDWEAHVHPDDRSRLRDSFARALDRREPHGAEYRYRDAGGHYLWLFEQAEPVYGADGGFRGYAGQCIDITERKRTEQALRDSDRRFRRFFDNPLSGMIIAGPDKVFLDVNEKLCDMLGYTREELIGRTWLDFTHPDDVASNVDLLADVIAGRSEGYMLEKRYRRRDGGTVHAIISARAVRDEQGRLKHLVTMLQDVTARRETERIMRAIVESTSGMTGEGFFRSLVQHLAQALNTRFAFVGQVGGSGAASIDTVAVWAGGALAPNFSYRLAGTPCARVVERREAGAYENGLQEAFPDFAPLLEIDAQSYAGAPLFDSTGRILGVIGVLDDKPLGDADKAEQLLRVFATRAGAELERKHAEEALLAAKAEAERANNAKSRFLAAASHDLRQPLSALALYLDVLRSKPAGPDQAVLDSMKDCVGSLSELLTDLLDLSKLEAGVITPKIADFAIDDMLAELVSVHAPEAQLKGLRLDRVASRLTARTDPVLFRRMLGNLLSNAVRYTERGGVAVGCRRREGKRWVEVWDSGIGFPEARTQEIFEEFKQLGGHARQRGSGLGLAIVARSAALLGLRVRVRSRPGLGSMFAIEMPEGTRKRRMIRESARPHALRIALIEDNASVRRALALALESFGHAAVEAENGSEIRSRLAGLAPDLVISDYRLGEKESGFDVIESLRAAFGEDLPAILVTGDTDPSLLRAMADRGIVVQHKPLDIAALQACMAALVKERSAG